MSGSLSRRRVVFTGYGMITASGRNVQETFQKCSQGISGIDFIRSFDTTGLPCQIAGEVSNEWVDNPEHDALFKLRKFSSRGVQLMQVAAAEAALQAGLDRVSQRQTIGVSLGSHGDNLAVADMQHMHRYYSAESGWDMERLAASGGYPFMNFFTRKPDVAASVLANAFNCRGPLLSIVSACAAGAHAIGEAANLIREGKCDLMLAGGCEATVNFVGMTGFILLKALCEKYASPQQASRPFDRRRNGFVMSEGAAAVVLEDLEHARARGAEILGEFKGYGSSADAYRITDTHPRGKGAIIAMHAAIKDAGITPDDIDYINAHGTSTTQNDLTETRAIKEVFGERAPSIPVSSNKSMLGHAIAAAGPIECVLSLEGIRQSVILPTINYESKDPKCRLDYVPNEARSAAHSNVLSNSFGFGGQNASLCVGAYTA